MDRIKHWRAERIDDFIGAANARSVGEVQRAAKDRSVFVALLLGQYGAGKTSLARWLMRSVCCDSPHPSTADPCGRCDGCLRQGVDYSGEYHTFRHWEVDCTGDVGRKEVADLVTEARGEDKPALFFDELHRLSESSAQHPLLKFAEDLRAGVLIAGAIYDPATQDRPPVLPALFSRMRKVYLALPTADEMVDFFDRKAVEWKVAAPEPVLRELVTRSGRSFRECLDRLDAAAATPGRTLTAEILDDTLPPAAATPRTAPMPTW